MILCYESWVTNPRFRSKPIVPPNVLVDGICMGGAGANYHNSWNFPAVIFQGKGQVRRFVTIWEEVIFFESFFDKKSWQILASKKMF